MDINRSNYEIWFIDLIDGNLSPDQVEKLNLFLDQNPDLKNEFNELSSVVLRSPENTFPNKSDLNKTKRDLSQSQFEYLAAAYVEKDMTTEQETEFMEIVDSDPDKKRSLGLIIRARLLPPHIRYSQKKNLKKITPAQRIMRLSVIGLSAAAVITLILTTYLNAPQNISEKKPNEVVAVARDSDLNVSLKQVAESTIDKNQLPVIKITNSEKHSVTQADLRTLNTDPDASLAEVAPGTNIIIRDAGIKKIIFQEINGIKGNIDYTTLAVSEISVDYIDTDDGRSNVGRFLSRTFRHTFLKDKSSSDAPVKGYEFAEVGVEGLNKLFGWEMALDKKNDENGDLKSIYFSSKLLKFNSPVKKSEPLP